MDFSCTARDLGALRRALGGVALGMPWPGMRGRFRAFLVGGKLLRGRFFLAHTRGGGLGRIRTAVGIELLHAASLVHDDIVDGDGVRRGGGAVWTWAGVGGGVLVGDWLLAQALRRLPGDIRLARLVEAMAAAEIRHMAGCGDIRGYRRDKTGRLFGYAAELAAPGDAGLRRRAIRFGILYQEADDRADGVGLALTEE